jgi:hypothetical protein
MAYTGILVRADTFENIFADPAIEREIAMAGEYLTVGTPSGVTYLNLAALSRIGIVNDDGTNIPGFKTSDIPINYDGTGFIKQETGWMLVKGVYKWYYEGLSGLKAASNTAATFTNGTDDATVNITALVTSQAKPAGITVSTTTAVVNFVGLRVRVYNETTGKLLGFIETSGETLTFAEAQTTGDIITACICDEDFNYSLKIKGIV